MLTTILIGLAGLVLLLIGGELLVRGSVTLSLRTGLSPLFVGLVIMGFGTSMPELLVSVQAALGGAGGLALGNVLGSNISNVLLIVGTTALISPIVLDPKSIKLDLAGMLVAALAVLVVAQFSMVTRLAAVGLLLLLAATLLVLARAGGGAAGGVVSKDQGQGNLVAAGAMLLAGLAALFFGADFLVGSASELARQFGVSEAVIGLTIVAVGTSLPELAASTAAAFRRQPEMAVANVIGSNIFNALGILGVTGVIAPFAVEQRLGAFDAPIMVAVLVGMAALLWLARGVPRLVGGGMLALYATYIALTL